MSNKYHFGSIYATAKFNLTCTILSEKYETYFKVPFTYYLEKKKLLRLDTFNSCQRIRVKEGD
jgi:hypothetical protein